MLRQGGPQIISIIQPSDSVRFRATINRPYLVEHDCRKHNFLELAAGEFEVFFPYDCIILLRSLRGIIK